jgi:hypothetical protein
LKAHERIEWLIAYSLTLVSALTASLYGFMSAAGPYGCVKGAGLFGVAFIGCHGPAWIMKAKRRIGWTGALFGFAVTVICLAATLWGGLGTNASGSAALRAERTKASTDVADDRAALVKIEREREALPVFTPATQDAVRAARDAVQAAEKITAAECERRGPRCRERENEEATARSALTATIGNAALTDQAAKLDNRAMNIRARLDRAVPVMDADPQASAFSQLTGIAVATSAALNAFWLSLAFELGAMFTMLIAYSNASTAVTAEPASVVDATPSLPASNVVTLAPGDVGKFATACLIPAPGKSVAAAELHEPYRQWCTDQGCRALGMNEFTTQFAALCDFAGVKKRSSRRGLLCLDLALSA